MGIKDRDSVESQAEEANSTAEPLPMEQAAPAASVNEAAARVAPRSTAPLALEALFLPLLHLTAPAAAVEASLAVETEEVCPVCAGVIPTISPAESTPPISDAGLGLSTLALGGVLSFLYQTHKKPKEEERQ
jgi:hypothetical protein